MVERQPPIQTFSGTGATMSGGEATDYGRFLALPIHETAVCPECGHTGVTIRGEEVWCHQCKYHWRWPLVAMDL